MKIAHNPFGTINLREVSFFYHDVQISVSQIGVAISTTCCAGDAYVCNDGDLVNWFCHTGDNDPNPTLTFMMPANMPFDKIIVYNRWDPCCNGRIVGANITVIDAGGSPVWRSMLDVVRTEYTFTYPSSSVQPRYLSS